MEAEIPIWLQSSIFGVLVVVIALQQKMIHTLFQDSRETKKLLMEMAGLTSRTVQAVEAAKGSDDAAE